MPVEFECADGRLRAYLRGELDHHNAAAIRVMIDGELERTMPGFLIFDLSGVTFMDSSGIGLILGRMRSMAAWNGRVYIEHPSETAGKIIKLSGLGNMIR